MKLSDQTTYSIILWSVQFRGVNTGGAGGAMAPPVFSHLCSKSRNLLSQLYKWPPQIFWTLAPPDFSTCLRPWSVLCKFTIRYLCTYYAQDQNLG